MQVVIDGPVERVPGGKLPGVVVYHQPGNKLARFIGMGGKFSCICATQELDRENRAPERKHQKNAPSTVRRAKHFKQTPTEAMNHVRDSNRRDNRTSMSIGSQNAPCPSVCRPAGDTKIRY